MPWPPYVVEVLDDVLDDVLLEAGSVSAVDVDVVDPDVDVVVGAVVVVEQPHWCLVVVVT